jgi:hypothetical protein
MTWHVFVAVKNGEDPILFWFVWKFGEIFRRKFLQKFSTKVGGMFSGNI